MSELYIGLMSGTSLDGVDAAVVDFSTEQPKLVANHYSPFTPELRQTILELCQPGFDEINRLGELDVILGKQFAQAVLTLLRDNHLTNADIRAIGSHGQTIRHHPLRDHPFTVQIGDPNNIAVITGITTVADFRRRDIALGGQGAPLVPAFHKHIFASKDTDRVILNIGGIANITLLPKSSDQPVSGYDTGPGNTLLNIWIDKHLQKPFDEFGAWASRGKANTTLLDTLLADSYFDTLPPKSTGREYFNLDWLRKHSQEMITSLNAKDVQATLTELTARSIIDAVKKHFNKAEIYVCGGGAHNEFLLSRLRALGPEYTIETTQKLGIHPDWVEAMAFAWLARQAILGHPGNVPAVTGAKEAAILGGIYTSNRN